MANDNFNPIEEARKRFPQDLQNKDDSFIYRNLSNPQQFREVFPEASKLSDEVISRNLAQYQPVPQTVGHMFSNLWEAGKQALHMPKDIYDSLTKPPQDATEESIATYGGKLGGLVANPVLRLAAKRMFLDPLVEERQKSIDEINKVAAGHPDADIHKAQMHYMASSLPVAGPMGAELADQALKGDWTGAVGKFLGWELTGELAGHLVGKFGEMGKKAETPPQGKLTLEGNTPDIQLPLMGGTEIVPKDIPETPASKARADRLQRVQEAQVAERARTQAQTPTPYQDSFDFMPRGGAGNIEAAMPGSQIVTGMSDKALVDEMVQKHPNIVDPSALGDAYNTIRQRGSNPQSGQLNSEGMRPGAPNLDAPPLREMATGPEAPLGTSPGITTQIPSAQDIASREGYGEAVDPTRNPPWTQQGEIPPPQTLFGPQLTFPQIPGRESSSAQYTPGDTSTPKYPDNYKINAPPEAVQATERGLDTSAPTSSNAPPPNPGAVFGPPLEMPTPLRTREIPEPTPEGFEPVIHGEFPPQNPYPLTPKTPGTMPVPEAQEPYSTNDPNISGKRKPGYYSDSSPQIEGPLTQPLRSGEKGKLGEGEDFQFNRDVEEVFKRAGAGIRTYIEDFKKRADLKEAARMDILDMLGRRKRSEAMANESVEAIQYPFRRYTLDQFKDFHEAAEGTKPFANPAAEKAYAATDEILAQDRKDMDALGAGHTLNWHENYLARIWKDPEKASGVVRSILAGNSPLQGSKNFFKKRSPFSTAEMIDKYGLEPISNNPITHQLLKHVEMRRYIEAVKTVRDMADKGMTAWIPDEYKNSAPEGWVPLEDKAFQRFEGNGIPKRGKYYAQKPVAETFNTFLSPGLGRYAPIRATRFLGNKLVQLKLLGLYHGLQSTWISAANDWGLASQVLSRGDYLSKNELNGQYPLVTAAQHLMRGSTFSGPTAAFIDTMSQLAHNVGVPFKPTALSSGTKLAREFSRPGAFPEMSKFADAMQQAGWGVHQHEGFLREATDAMLQDVANKSPRLMISAPMAAIEKASVPLFREYIPKLKASAFYHLAKDIMEQMPEDSPARRQAFIEAADSVDNRAGMMQHDRRFWDRALKDTFSIAYQAPGWNIGSAAWLKNVATGIPELPKRLATGKGLTLDQAQLAGYVGLSATLGAVAQYIWTGKSPESKLDYFAPRNGKTSPTGQEERIPILGYIKDWMNFQHDWKGTLLNKIHPLINGTYEALRNRAYSGEEIYSEDDSAPTQVSKSVGHVLSQAEPISLETLRRERAQFATPSQQIRATMGFNPAPRWMGESPAEETARNLADRLRAQGPITHAQAQHMDEVSNLRVGYESGHITMDRVAEALRQGKISAAEYKNLITESQEKPLVRHVRRLDARSAMQVWQKSTPEERQQILPLVVTHLATALKSRPEDEQEDYIRMLEDVTKPQASNVMPRR